MKFSINRAFFCCLIAVVVLQSSLRAQTPAAQRTDNTSTAVVDEKHAQLSANTNADDSYTIGVDDLLSISVWKEPELSKQIPVRSDGKISMPLIGEVQAEGHTPSQLEKDITSKLKSFITDPQVTVIVQQINSQKFNILGQVSKPGLYPISAGMTIVDAIGTAGGFKDFAKKKSIYVLRKSSEGDELRIPFNYNDFVKGKDTDKNIVLKPHDTIVVP